jgi:hypothetical protein
MRKLYWARRRLRRGLTLLEVLLALFILLVGIVGVLAALPTGIESAHNVIFQDVAIHLAHSKFAEFRRDRINPRLDLVEGSAYLAARHEPVNASGGGWRDFAHEANGAYKDFDGIERYEWRVEQKELQSVGVSEAFTPQHNAGTDIGVTRVSLAARMKGAFREFRFTQYMAAYQP